MVVLFIVELWGDLSYYSIEFDGSRDFSSGSSIKINCIYCYTINHMWSPQRRAFSYWGHYYQFYVSSVWYLIIWTFAYDWFVFGGMSKEVDDCLLAQIFFFGCPVWLAGYQFPIQGLNLGPQQWKLGVLTTRPPGNSFQILFIYLFIHSFIHIKYFFGCASS